MQGSAKNVIRSAIVSEIIAQLIPQTFFCCNFRDKNNQINSCTNFCCNFSLFHPEQISAKCPPCVKMTDLIPAGFFAVIILYGADKITELIPRSNFCARYLPWSSFPCFLGKSKENHTKKARISFLLQTLKIPGQEIEKRSKKQGNSVQRK